MNLENLETKDCIAHWVSKVHIKLKQSMANKVKEYNLTVEQRTILLLLFDNESMTQAQICKETDSEASNITVTLKRMEQNGFISKAKHPTDKRTTIITATKKAQNLKEDLQQMGLNSLEYLLKDISEDEHDIALNVMKTIYKKALQEELEAKL